MLLLYDIFLVVAYVFMFLFQVFPYTSWQADVINGGEHAPSNLTNTFPIYRWMDKLG